MEFLKNIFQIHKLSRIPVGTLFILTGFAMMQIMASGQWRAQASASVATIVALVLNRSSRVIPRKKGKKNNLQKCIEIHKNFSFITEPNSIPKPLCLSQSKKNGWISYFTFTQIKCCKCHSMLTINALKKTKYIYIYPPGFLGTPAGMTTTSQPFSAAPSWSAPMYPAKQDSEHYSTIY